MTDSKLLDVARWGHMYAATQLMQNAWQMISDALMESDNMGDPLNVSHRLTELMNDACGIVTDMKHETSKYLQNSLNDDKATSDE